MKKPAVPLDETVRLVSLHSLRLLDSAPEDRFDRITSMAKRLFEMMVLPAGQMQPGATAQVTTPMTKLSVALGAIAGGVAWAVILWGFLAG